LPGMGMAPLSKCRKSWILLPIKLKFLQFPKSMFTQQDSSLWSVL
jgi:hypothetical protein